MEIVYNPPYHKPYPNLASIPTGAMFRLPAGKDTAYMRLSFMSDSCISKDPLMIFAIDLSDGNCYSFADREVIKLDGNLTVWEV